MIEASRIAFDPFLPWPWLIALGIVCALAVLTYLILRGRAWLTRAVGLILLVAAASNPSFVQEEREPLPSVAALILDRSDSMDFGDRAALSQAAFETLTTQLEANPSIDLRTIEVETSGDGTQLIGALEGLMADVPRDRIAGAILITDGQVHDIPENAERLTDLGPIHGVITGDPDASDRRITLVDAPNFGIVGDEIAFTVRVDDPTSARVPIDVSINGERLRTITAQAGEDTVIDIETERRGDNIVVFETPRGSEELTLANNRTAATLAGVRDGLRVLLVTGRPNASGRVWRDLLKSDPSVDLVHFTILRSAFKFDITPVEELALIAFPTEELFEEKLPDFDLLIFDQYERRGIITMAYLADVANYVDEGGALLIAGGPEFSSGGSLARTPLAGVLPAIPTGSVIEGKVVPELSETGKRHTVTEALDGLTWGPWLRYTETVADTGDVLMIAPDGSPLLAVDRVGDGRVAQLNSDQIWLWARGYEGGGPFADLIRRTVHWLMKEPELDELQLKLTAQGDTIRADLRTLAERAAPLMITAPDGSFLEPDWREEGPGSYSAEVPVDQLGLYRAESGGLSTVSLNGPANPREFSALEATPDVLQPLTNLTEGGTYQVTNAQRAPDIRMVGQSANANGRNWLGLRERGAYAVRSSTSLPLLPGVIAMLFLLATLVWAWRREGR
ncbi:MAG: glutamine amidotransferase [Pseudomonadota bacterium]